MSSITKHKSRSITIALDSCTIPPQSSGSLLVWMKLRPVDAEKSKETSSGTIKTIDEVRCFYRTDQDEGNPSKPPIKRFSPYFGRILFVHIIFTGLSCMNAFQWIQYSSMTSVLAEYYGVSNQHVNLTSMVFMITHILFIIPASSMLERLAMRRAIVLGTLCTVLGSFIKWQLGGAPTLTSFWWLMAGQTIVALSQLCLVNIPRLLVSVCSSDELTRFISGVLRVSTANLNGIGLGFFIPMLIENEIRETKLGSQMIGQELNVLSTYNFGMSLAYCVISVLFLPDELPKPPGSSNSDPAQQPGPTKSQQTESVQIERNDNANQIQTSNSIKELCRHPAVRSFILSYGIQVGGFFALATVLNQMLHVHWQNHQIHFTGPLGYVFAGIGFAAFPFWYLAFYRTQFYRFHVFTSYLSSLLAMVTFFIMLQVLRSESPPTGALSWAAIILGFNMSVYLPLGLQVAAEMTYQEPSYTLVALLNLSAQVFGLILTFASSLMIDHLGSIYAYCFLSVSMRIGLVLSIIMKVEWGWRKAVDEE